MYPFVLNVHLDDDDDDDVLYSRDIKNKFKFMGQKWREL